MTYSWYFETFAANWRFIIHRTGSCQILICFAAYGESKKSEHFPTWPSLLPVIRLESQNCNAETESSWLTGEGLLGRLLFEMTSSQKHIGFFWMYFPECLIWFQILPAAWSIGDIPMLSKLYSVQVPIKQDNAERTSALRRWSALKGWKSGFNKLQRPKAEQHLSQHAPSYVLWPTSSWRKIQDYTSKSRVLQCFTILTWVYVPSGPWL